jgi:hypothetical protein
MNEILVGWTASFPDNPTFAAGRFGKQHKEGSEFKLNFIHW